MSVEILAGIKAVFFDHDDTLVRTREIKLAHHRYVAEKHYGKVLSDDLLFAHYGKPLSKLVCLLYGINDPDEGLGYLANYEEQFPKQIFEETIPTLQYMHDRGKLTGIITACSRDAFEYDLKLHRVPRDLIDYTQTEEETLFHKPDPKVFEPAKIWLAERQINPEEVLYVGDALNDMKAALGAGFNFAGVHTGVVSAEEFSTHGVKSIPGIGDLIR